MSGIESWEAVSIGFIMPIANLTVSVIVIGAKNYPQTILTGSPVAGLPW